MTSILTPEPPVLQIGANNQEPILVIGSKMFQSPLSFTPTLEPIPVLAKRWIVSRDRREYVFTLQANVRFHDGRRMTSSSPS